MPELPEVECLAGAVRPLIQGKILRSAGFLRGDLRVPIPVARFREVLVGQAIAAVERRSKYMLLKTAKGYGIIHLGMTGNLIHRPSATPELAHTHAVFEFRDAKDQAIYLHYVDPRRFGRIDCAEGHNLLDHPLFQHLGPEPMGCSANTLGAHLARTGGRRRVPIKSLIMDAHTVVGVGNIYASESLFQARIHPLAAAGDLSKGDYLRLAAAIQRILSAAIAAGGTSFRDFRHADGGVGYFVTKLDVYGRDGDPCSRCERPIEIVRLAGRGTFFCSRCQRKKA